MNQKEIFLLSLTIFLTIIAWMLMDIYRIRSNVSTSANLEFKQVVDFKLEPKILKVLKDKAP